MLGEATNNVAEYRGAAARAPRAQELGADEVEVVNDSELVAKQVNGEYKVKHPDMKPLHREALEALGRVRALDGALGPAGPERRRRRARQPGARRAHGLMRETLRSLSGYGGALFDLDGTLYRGDTALPGRRRLVRACRDAGLKVASARTTRCWSATGSRPGCRAWASTRTRTSWSSPRTRWPPSCRPQGTRTSSGSGTPACARAWSAWASRRRT